ncbi:MAG: hypothetical protein PF637_10225 [Spirochaetes bacterium]|nr:hypothetical protein [Spirochaetota bacterium]
MVKSENSVYAFPERITFEHIPELYTMIDSFIEENIVLDLSATIYIHSAFIGFLIYLKSEKEKRNLSFNMIPSEWIETLFSRLGLIKFFIDHKRSA